MSVVMLIVACMLLRTTSLSVLCIIHNLHVQMELHFVIWMCLAELRALWSEFVFC